MYFQTCFSFLEQNNPVEDPTREGSGNRIESQDHRVAGSAARGAGSALTTLSISFNPGIP